MAVQSRLNQASLTAKAATELSLARMSSQTQTTCHREVIPDHGGSIGAHDMLIKAVHHAQKHKKHAFYDPK